MRVLVCVLVLVACTDATRSTSTHPASFEALGIATATSHVLPLPAGMRQAEAYAVNATNTVVGYGVDTHDLTIPGCPKPVIAIGAAVTWDSAAAPVKLTNAAGAVASYALAVNNDGVIVGYDQHVVGCTLETRGVRWSAGAPHLLPPLPGASINGSMAVAVDSSGDAAGTVIGADGLVHCVRWLANGSSPEDLWAPYHGGSPSACVATGINDNGWVSGYLPDNGSPSSWLFTSCCMHGLVPASNTLTGMASGIDDDAVVVGNALLNGQWQAFTASDGFPGSLLPTPAGASGTPAVLGTGGQPIDMLGHIVGYAPVGATGTAAAVWTSTGSMLLPTPGGVSSTYGYGVNWPGVSGYTVGVGVTTAGLIVPIEWTLHAE